MDIESAIRRYEQIVPSPVSSANLPRREIRVWLARYVGEVVHELANRATFREYASWSVYTLRKGAKSRERALIDKIEQQFQICSAALLKLINSKLIKRKLNEFFPPKSAKISETVVLAGGKTKSVSSKLGLVNEIEIEIAQLQALAKGKEQPLVNINDYFEPQQEWFGAKSQNRIQRGEWVLALNPEMLPVDDFVVQCLLKRIKLRHELLRSLNGKCKSVMSHIQRDYRKPLKALNTSYRSLEMSIATIESQLHTGPETKLREACVVATQVYAAFSPAPHLDWLGLDGRVIEADRTTLTARTEQWRGPQLIDRVAAALRVMRSLLAHDPEQSAIEEVIAAGGLVIVEKNRKVHWERNCIAKKFTTQQWKLLVALASRAKQHAAVEESHLFGRTTSRQALCTACQRLRQRLPATLSKMIIPGSGLRTYRLDLEPHRIYLFLKQSGE